MQGIEFVNDVCCNYLTIPYEGKETDFALRMMTENAAEAFLSVELRRLDGQTYLYYKISRMQNMETLYGEKPMDRQMFQTFMWQLHEAIEESRELFLPGDGICLEPMSLFWELGTGRWKFLYIPGRDVGESKETQSEREHLAEFFVMHIDYEDKELTETVYRFYEEVCAGIQFPWGNFADKMYIQERGQQNKYADFYQGKEEREGDLGHCISDSFTGTLRFDKGRSDCGFEEWEEEKREIEKPEDEGSMEEEYFGIRESEKEEEWKVVNNRGSRKQPIILCIFLCVAIAVTFVSGRIMPEMMLYGGTASALFAVILLVALMRRKKRKDSSEKDEYGVGYAADAGTEEFFYHIAGEEEKPASENRVAEERTVYMDIRNSQERKLYGIGKYRRQKIFLEKLPCLVGKDNTLIDYVVADPSVSRMHAKFLMEGDTIWLQDLNSTNGTYHNGMRLRPNEKVALEPEDEVGFGQAQFVFR